MTSDARLKEVQSEEILNKSFKIYDNLKPICYKYKNITEDDDYSRTHIGFLAQDIEQEVIKAGLTSEDCALIQKDPLSASADENIKKICSDGYRYYLNYNELHGLHTLKNH